MKEISKRITLTNKIETITISANQQLIFLALNRVQSIKWSSVNKYLLHFRGNYQGLLIRINQSCLPFSFHVLRGQRGERVETVRTGETNEAQRIRAMLFGVCVQCGAHGTPVAAKSWPGRRQSCDLGK